MLRVKNETTKDTKINCILRFLRGKIETNIDDVKLSEVDIINSTVHSIDSIGSITFEMVKQEVQRDQKMWRPVDTITNLVDYDNLPD